MDNLATLKDIITPIHDYVKKQVDYYQSNSCDGEEKQQGKWLIEGGTTLHFCCSECGCAGDNWDKFCKHCGARMEVKKNEQ